MKTFKHSLLIPLFYSFVLFVQSAYCQEDATLLDKWEMNQNKKAYQRSLDSSEFVSLGLGCGSNLDIARVDAKLDAKFQLPQKIQLYIETVSSVDQSLNSVLKMETHLNIRNVQYEEVSNTKYDGKFYVAILACKNKKEFIDDASIIGYSTDNQSLNTLAKSNNDIKNNNSENTTYQSKEVRNWEDQQYTEYNKMAQNQTQSLIALGIGSGTNEDIAKEKAKIYATILLPEKESVYIQTISEVYTKYAVTKAGNTESDAKNNFRAKALSRKKIASINYKILNKFVFQGDYYFSMLAIKDRNAIFNDFGELFNSSNVKDAQLKINQNFEQVINSK